MCVNLLPERVDVSHVVTAGKARPEIVLCDSYRMEGGAVATLSRLRRELRLDQHRCTTLLRSADYQFLAVEAPANVPAQEAKIAVRWRLKDMIDYHVDDATIDVLDVPTPASAGQRGRYMYTVAARNSAIRETIERFAAGGLPLTVIDIPDTAQRNLAARFETEQRGVLALSFDAQGGLLTVTFNGELYLTRRVEATSAHLSSGGERRD